MPDYKKGVFCISLDFELQWGVFEKMTVGNPANNYFHNTRFAIPQMLQLFSQYDIQVTWAIVGMIFNQNLEMWKNNRPDLIPDYANKTVSSYHWCDEQHQHIQESNLFAPDLIDQIKSTPGVEIGTHTYSHFYCQEKGQTPDQFKADLEKAIQLALSKGIVIESLVFPRNQFNPAYLEVCRQVGIKSVRTNPDKWYWDTSKKDALAIKLMRTGDAWLPINKKSIVAKESIDSSLDPVQLPASRLYKAWTKNKLLNALKLKRIFSEMTKAAKLGRVYHLWWHPHNFGYHPVECLAELKAILEHYSFLKKEHGFLSLNMKGLRNHLINYNA